MKHIKQDVSFKTCPPPPPRRPGELKGLDRVQNSSFFKNIDMLHIKLKKIALGSNMVANVNL